ncbi:Luciferin 4-monooxygenase [Eumeta japonica]|uniref:Luciferin 4-monooxygenase n=1 Tax=Eumeta variegata TaxID=151549 RepID=A0A4C1YW87_EUMVA|nr:Luciferin 4-monooxygenase [Eumeta japonica]
MIRRINDETGEETTYGEFLQDVANISISLAALGIGKGHTVAICSARNNTFVATALAVICTGATYTPLDVTAGKAVVRHNLGIAKPSYVICSRLFWDNYKDVLSSLDFIEHYVRFDDVPEDATAFAALRSRRVDVGAFEAADVRGADDVAMVLYSSGTTGPSKGVLLTHLNLLLS